MCNIIIKPRKVTSNVAIKPTKLKLNDQLANVKVTAYDNPFDCLLDCIFNNTESKACQFTSATKLCTIYTNGNYIMVKSKGL